MTEEVVLPVVVSAEDHQILPGDIVDLSTQPNILNVETVPSPAKSDTVPSPAKSENLAMEVVEADNGKAHRKKSSRSKTPSAKKGSVVVSPTKDSQVRSSSRVARRPYTSDGQQMDYGFCTKLFTFWRSCRPWTLSVSFVQSILTLVILNARMNVPITPIRAVLSTMAFIAVQTFANIHNAYTDYYRGLDTKENAKDRVLVDAIISPRMVVFQMFSFILCFFAFMLHTLIYDPRSEDETNLLAGIGIAGLFATYSYSGWPLALKTRGCGELLLFICIGICLPAFQSVYVCGVFHPEVLLLGIAPSIMHSGMNHANNFRDIEVDRNAGLKTSANILGHFWARMYYNLLVLVLPFGGAIFVAWYCQCMGVLCALHALPLSIMLTRLAKGSPQAVLVLVKRTSIVVLTTGLCCAVGIYTMPFMLPSDAPSLRKAIVGLASCSVIAATPVAFNLLSEVEHVKYW